MKIIINNHLSHALDWIAKQNLTNTTLEHNIEFSPVIKNDAQSSFFKQRFLQLQNDLPHIKYSPVKDIRQIQDSDYLFTTDAYFEKNHIKANQKLTYFNRLFTREQINFRCPNSFTQFRKKVESILPRIYDDAVSPQDKNVQEHIQSYFYDNEYPSIYFKTRNGMLNAEDSTRFSSYLSCGAIDVRYLYNEVKKYEKRVTKNKSTYWIIFELLWREFFYWHYQEYQQLYFSHSGLHSPTNYSKFDHINIDEFEHQYGDNPFILAALKELKATGFQSNRTRQIFASFLIQCTHYHWRQGAELFERYLIDYDVYSNWGNWMYLSGYGVDPRGSRFFSIPKQLKNYDPNLEYIRYWCPEYKNHSQQEIFKKCINQSI